MRINTCVDRLIFTLLVFEIQDIIANFNQNRSSGYNNTKVAIGDLLIVHYVAEKNDTKLSLDKSNIESIYLGLNMIQKGDPIKKY